MREVLSQSELKIVLKDSLNKPLGEPFSLKVGINRLKIPAYNCFYESVDEDKTRLYIYPGKGLLRLENCFKKYNFKYLNISLLDHFLCFKKHHEIADEVDKRLIGNFLELLSLNLKEESKDLIKPHFYDDILKNFNLKG